MHSQCLKKAAGLSQKELSQLAGINLRTLQQYEIVSKDINRASGQSIIGFNMEVRNVERVNETISTIRKNVLEIGTVFFLIFELAPDFVISLFGKNNSPKYTEYARLCVRIFLSGIILTCFIKSAAIMLQSLGKSGKSTLLALLRDVIIFVPSSIILALISHNIVTMFWASLISDVISFIFAVIFIKAESKNETKNT